MIVNLIGEVQSAEQDLNLQKPEATVLQTACLIICISADVDKRRERDSNSQLVFTSHRFSRPAQYHLWHHDVILGAGFEPASSQGAHDS